MQKTEIIILKADEGKWLYHDEVDGEGRVTRNFVHGVHNADLNDWIECTDEEKVAWEEENLPKPEPLPEMPAPVEEPTEVVDVTEAEEVQS